MTLVLTELAAPGPCPGICAMLPGRVPVQRDGPPGPRLPVAIWQGRRSGQRLEALSNVDSLSDDELLAGVRDGDPAAFEAFYDRHQGTAMALAYRILGDRGAAEDVVQESFLAVWRRAGTFEPTRGSGRSWLLALVHHRAIDRLRRRRAQPLEHELEAAAELSDPRLPDVFDAAYQSLRRDRIRAALEVLSSEQRQTIELAYFAGHTQQEIATETGVALGTVKSRTRLALTRLKQILDRELAGAT